MAIFPTLFSFRLTSFSVESLWILRVVAGSPGFHHIKTVFRKPYVSSLSHFFTVSDINYLFGSDLWTMVNVLSWPSLNSSSGNFDADWWKFISINKVFSLDNSARLMTQCPTQTFDDTSWVSSDELLSKDEVPATIRSLSCSSRFVFICLESNETFQILDDCYEISVI